MAEHRITKQQTRLADSRKIRHFRKPQIRLRATVSFCRVQFGIDSIWDRVEMPVVIVTQNRLPILGRVKTFSAMFYDATSTTCAHHSPLIL